MVLELRKRNVARFSNVDYFANLLFIDGTVDSIGGGHGILGTQRKLKYYTI